MHDNETHWSYGKEKTTLFYPIHSSILLPILCCIFINTSWLWVVLWLGVDLIISKKGMTLVAYFRRLKLTLGRLFHKGNRVRKNKYHLNKLKRGLYE